MSTTTETRLHSGYVILFVTFTGCLLVGDLLDLNVWVRRFFWVAWLALEGIGFARKGMGDTFTEINLALLRAKPDFLPVVLGWIVWFLWQPVEILPWGARVEAWVPVPELGLIFLFVGGVLWWPAHLLVTWWKERDHG